MQQRHLNGFSPVCILGCVFKLCYREKILSQVSDFDNFSRVCTLCPISKIFATEKALAHTSHLKGLSPV